jgi:hypothetical protein
VAAAGDDVQFAVAVHVCGKNVGGTGMLAGQAMFLERLGGILPRLPPCEPFALAGFDRRSALGGEGDVEPAVTVEVAGPEVMAQAGRVVLGEHVTCPPIGLAGIKGISFGDKNHPSRRINFIFFNLARLAGSFRFFLFLP